MSKVGYNGLIFTTPVELEDIHSTEHMSLVLGAVIIFRAIGIGLSVRLGLGLRLGNTKNLKEETTPKT